jgi:predicted GIY-YIG superfamily endonuclease
MSEERPYFVYIIADASKRVYTGMTKSLRRRMREHQLKLTPGFAAKYNITGLVYFESFEDVRNAIERARSRSRPGLVPNGLCWLSLQILNGMTCRGSGISRRLFALCQGCRKEWQSRLLRSAVNRNQRPSRCSG